MAQDLAMDLVLSKADWWLSVLLLSTLEAEELEELDGYAREKIDEPALEDEVDVGEDDEGSGHSSLVGIEI